MLCQPIGRFAQRLGRLPEGVRHIRERLAGGFGIGLDFIQQTVRCLAAVHHLARDQIHRLNAIGAFVDRGHPHISAVLRGPCFFDKAHATVDLNAHFSDGHAGVGAKGLGDRSQEGRPGFPFGLSGRVRHVDGLGTAQRDGAGGKGFRLHRHQHAAYISMIHDGAGAVGA